MELIILLSLMTALASSASLDAELCGRGESFWCQSLAIAKTCRAVDHCKETVWKNMNLEECKELIGEEALLQIGDSELALRMMCCSLGICNRDAILEPRENLPLKMKHGEWSLSKASPPVKCRVCQKFISSLQTRLKTSGTQESLLNVLRVEICSLVPAVNTDMCMRAVESTLPMILKLFLHFYDHKMICQQLTVCPLEEDGLDQYDIDSNMLHLPLIEDQNNIDYCKKCQDLINFITDQNISGIIEKTLLSYFCQDICPFQTLCKGFLKLLVPHIAKDLTNWLLSKKVKFCHHMELCENSNNSVSLLLHKQHQQLLAAKKPNEETTVCQLCLQVFKTTIDSEAVNKTEMTFLNAMRMACDSLWWPYGSHCHRMVDAVGRQTLEKLSQRLHPESVCETLGFCDGATNVDFIQSIVETVTSERCSYCQSTTEYLAVLLGQEQAVNEIQSQMKRICEFRPFGINEEECESVVDKYTPMFVDYLTDDLSQDDVCQRASLCTGLTSNDGSGVTMAAIPPSILDLWPQFKCLYGSQFWCATVDNAKLCLMEQYCGREWK